MFFFFIYTVQSRNNNGILSRQEPRTFQKKFPGGELVFYMYFQLKATELNAFLK